MQIESRPDQTSPGPVDVHKLPFRLLPNEQRVILLSFTSPAKHQTQIVFEFLEHLTESEIFSEFDRIQRRYSGRHIDFQHRILENYEKARSVAGLTLSGDTRKLLAGAYFTMEYAFQASALFNPSIVPHPDQSELNPGSMRFVMSLRAVGEGHVSSVVFHTGILDGDGGVHFDPAASCTAPAQSSPDRFYLKALFHRRLVELGFADGLVEECLKPLSSSFTAMELEGAAAQIRISAMSDNLLQSCIESMLWLGRSNYQLRLAQGSAINQLFLFPKSDNESRGIEDLRLVRFLEDDGHAIYYGTYTAFNGSRIMPVLIETLDFRTVSVHTLNGAGAQNKGMALFPRRVNGHYAMCSRIDGRNLFLMFSDHIHFWESAQTLAVPKYAWEYRLIGNCGSPIETSEGWLLITHGVGAMRQYAIGAMLLDRNDPSQIRGRLREPLIVSTEDEREGYVPNVVYSCGSVLWKTKLILPYAISDRKTAIAEIEVDALLQRLLADGP
jgi:predicted GH43/DUF377 family glycosyl hydrolase